MPSASAGGRGKLSSAEQTGLAGKKEPADVWIDARRLGQ